PGDVAWVVGRYAEGPGCQAADLVAPVLAREIPQDGAALARGHADSRNGGTGFGVDHTAAQGPGGGKDDDDAALAGRRSERAAATLAGVRHDPSAFAGQAFQNERSVGTSLDPAAARRPLEADERTRRRRFPVRQND